MRAPRPHSGSSNQCGAALLVMLIIMIIGGMAYLVSSLNSSTLNIARDKVTADALKQAKEALIGYAISDANRPGELPCPDFNNDGKITVTGDYSGSNCKSLIGWLPWEKLGLPELHDGNGDHLWYVVADPFHANSSVTLNSDTSTANSAQMLTIQDGSTGATLESGIIAIIFSPGTVLSSESRSLDDNNATNSVQNYLEDENANLDTVFKTANSTINDRLIVISNNAIFSPVEIRIAREVKNCLDDYAASDASKYPWAAPDTSYTGTYNTLFGWFPAAPNTDIDTLHTTDPSMPNTSWDTISTCNAIINSSYWTDWKQSVFYQIADGYQPGGSASCTAGGTCLTVNGTGNTAAGSHNDYHATVIVARQAIGQTRPSTNTSDYLEGSNLTPGSSPPTFETYKSSDSNYSTVNDLVLCLDARVNCL